MLQKYFPVLAEVNSPLASLIALNVAASAAKIIISGVSNDTLETLLWASVSFTETCRKEVEISTSELEKTRTAAAKAARYYRYRAACAAREARAVSKLSRQVKAVKRPVAKPSLKGLSGLSLEDCRAKAAEAQVAVRVATTTFNTAHEAVAQAVKGGDSRTIRAKVAALKAAVRTLEVRQLELYFAREMLAISLARHSA